MPPDFYAQSELQQQQIQAEQGMNAPALQQQQQQLQAALVEQTNPSHILEDVEQKLRGKKPMMDGSYQKIGEPLMNEKGIGRMIFTLSSVVNQNTILYHLENQEIGNIIVRLSNDIIDDLVLNWQDYGIVDKILLDSIVDAVIFPAFASLKRAWKQNEKNWLNKTVVESISSSPRPYLKKEGVFSKLKL